MASLVLNGNTSGSVTISSPAVSGTTTLTLPTTSGTVVASDTSGNVGIGTGAITQLFANYTQLGIKGGTTVAGGTLQFTTSNGTIATNLVCDTNATYLAAVGSSGLVFSVGGSGTGTERMRIDSAGNVLVGKTTSSSSTAGLILYGQSTISGYGRIDFGKTVSGTVTGLEFANSGTPVGTITYSNTATAYNTSSDYRLKENIAPMTGALAKISALKPCTYTWKADGSASEGFIAHELAEVVPDCVTGEKDAVETYKDEDGIEQTRIKPQGIDTSFLVATLTAAIQEQQTIIESLKTDIAELKAKVNV